ncbi:MAG: Maf family nucleotide pyrophosphatase [Flavobacteriales bacterium]|nr:septum formation protein Maf [Flavobacteriales bacterium]MCZ2442391.1 Maf family nucleotide pyrophosphatase [Flavobacteriales bacterium]
MHHSLDIPYQIILGSRSPRRHQLLSGLDIPFQVMIKETDEDYPPNLSPKDVAEYLCQKKAAAFVPELSEHPDLLIITADTLVSIDKQILNKPLNEADALRMLKLLSGRKHTVYTGVCLRNSQKTFCFSVSTDVYFRVIKASEMAYYIEHYKPYDKAGSYGAQDWIGLSVIEKIDGCYYNVMGLPTQALYLALLRFIS